MVRNPPGVHTDQGDTLERVIEKVLEKKKLVPADETQRRRVPFTAAIMEKPLPRKFKMPHMT